MSENLSDLKLPFPIGAVVWAVGPAHRKVPVTCPHCLGQRRVTLLLASGERLSLECEMCRADYQSKGMVWEWVLDAKPERFTCASVDVTFREGELRTRYSEQSDGYGISKYADELYLTEEECQVACDASTRATKAQHEEQALRHKHNTGERLCSNAAHWHRRLAEVEKERVRLLAWIQRLEAK